MPDVDVDLDVMWILTFPPVEKREAPWLRHSEIRMALLPVTLPVTFLAETFIFAACLALRLNLIVTPKVTKSVLMAERDNLAPIGCTLDNSSTW